MATKTRLYKVVTPTRVRLIEAATAKGAIAFAANTDFTASVPAQHEIFQMARDGIDIEVATATEVSDETRNAVAQEDLAVTA